MEEHIYHSGQSGIKLKSDSLANECILNEKERAIVEHVCSMFKDMNAGEVSEISHKEKAWIDNQDKHSEISYQEAFALNYD